MYVANPFNQNSILGTVQVNDKSMVQSVHDRSVAASVKSLPVLSWVADLLLGRLAMTILDPDRSRTVSIDFIDNPYHGNHYANEVPC
ncbi:hypothetical protein C8039_08440 [Halogeometricum sp. wsp3]|nr:hypothetical protein C8039_08440 [Halogeometricum sp. wsp3]